MKNQSRARERPLGLTVYRIEDPEGFGIPGPRRGEERRTSGVNLAAWMVIVSLFGALCLPVA